MSGTPPKHVLIVDDDPDLVECLAELFTSAGYSVTTAADGLEATAKLELQRFDAILTDYMMPRANGLQFVANAKNSALNSLTPLFVVSGVVDGRALKGAADLQVIKVLPKPMDWAKLLEMVERHIQDGEHVLNTDPQVMSCFIQALTELVKTYLKEPIAFGKMALFDGPMAGLYATATVPLLGGNAHGLVSCSFARRILERLGVALFGGAVTELSERLEADMAGELVSQVAGRAKPQLAKLGVHFDLGMPHVTLGMGHKLLRRMGAPIVRFDYNVGGPAGFLDCGLVRTAPTASSRAS